MAKRRKKQETVEEQQVKQDAVNEVSEDDKMPDVDEVLPKLDEALEEIGEPKVDEAPKVVKVPKKEQVKDVKQTFETIFKEASKDPVLATTAEALNNYVNVCYKQNSQDGATIASMNYNLFNIIIGTLNDTDRKISNKKMNFINKVFLIEKDGYFNPVSLSRYDHFWSFGPESKMGYSMLIKYISELSNPNTRKAKAKIMPAERMAKFLPEGLVGKLETFYKL